MPVLCSVNAVFTIAAVRAVTTNRSMLLVRRFGGALRVGTRCFGANGRRALDALRSTSALDWQFSRASGPGGQHVNKVNTRAELRLDLDRATDTAALPRAVADRLAATARALSSRGRAPSWTPCRMRSGAITVSHDGE